MPYYEEILQVIKRLPNEKAPGPDGITAELLKQGREAAVAMTVELVQHIWKTQDIPDDLAKASIILIPKDHSQQRNPEAQRPISLMNVWLKVIDKLIQHRLKVHLDKTNARSDVQAGFTPGHSCAQQATALELVCEMAYEDN